MKNENKSGDFFYPERQDCFHCVYPVCLKIGDVFTTEGISSLSLKDGRVHQLLRKVTKIESLNIHLNHVVISSILIGATVSRIIYKHVVLKDYKLVITKYYNEDHVNKKDCNFKDEERPELFSISTKGKPQLYLVDIAALKPVKVPIEEDSNYLGYF